MEVDEPNASAVTSHSKRLKIEPIPLSYAEVTERSVETRLKPNNQKVPPKCSAKTKMEKEMKRS